VNFLGIILALLLSPAPVKSAGSVTLLEGSLRVIRGAQLLQGVEGMSLKQGDILESGENGFAQLEFSGGGIVALGPSSRFYILRHSGERASQTELVLLSGWLKGESTAGAGSYRYATPILAAGTSNGTVLIHNSEGTCDVFVESGSAAIAEVGADGSARTPGPAKASQFFTRKSGKAVTSQTRPAAAFLDAMPRPFRDTLPSRLAHFGGKSLEPKASHPVSYGEVQAWLTMPARWRTGFVQRFEPRLNDPEFRKQLEVHVAEHPEWDQVLHPESTSEDKPATASNP